jgi:hypothetical protein
LDDFVPTAEVVIMAGGERVAKVFFRLSHGETEAHHDDEGRDVFRACVYRETYHSGCA